MIPGIFMIFIGMVFSMMNLVLIRVLAYANSEIYVRFEE